MPVHSLPAAPYVSASSEHGARVDTSREDSAAAAAAQAAAAAAEVPDNGEEEEVRRTVVVQLLLVFFMFELATNCIMLERKAQHLFLPKVTIFYGFLLL